MQSHLFCFWRWTLARVIGLSLLVTLCLCNLQVYLRLQISDNETIWKLLLNNLRAGDPWADPLGLLGPSSLLCEDLNSLLKTAVTFSFGRIFIVLLVPYSMLIYFLNVLSKWVLPFMTYGFSIYLKNFDYNHIWIW